MHPWTRAPLVEGLPYRANRTGYTSLVCRMAPSVVSLLGLVGLLLLVNGAAAQEPVRVEAHVSADSVKVGERFTLSLAVEYVGGESIEVIFPSNQGEAASPLFGDLRVIRRETMVQEQETEAGRLDSVAYEVTTFALDSARVPVLPVRLVAGTDTTVVATSPSVLPVTSVVGPEATALRDSVALASFPRPLWEWGLLALGALVLLGGLVYGVWQWRTLEATSAEPEEDPRTPYEAAMAELQNLERRNPNDRSTFKAFYVDLADVLRTYLAREVGVAAREQTTREVVDALERRPDVPDQATQRIRTVLERADLVKFAGAASSPNEVQTVLRDARATVNSIEAAQRRAERTSAKDVSAPA